MNFVTLKEFSELLNMHQKSMKIQQESFGVINFLLERCQLLEEKVKKLEDATIRNISTDAEQRGQTFQDSVPSGMGSEGQGHYGGSDDSAPC